jgi:hypothetical protein
MLYAARGRRGGTVADLFTKLLIAAARHIYWLTSLLHSVMDLAISDALVETRLLVDHVC